MAIPLLAIGAAATLAGAAASALGAAKGASTTKKARQEELNSYNDAKQFLTSEYYRSPLESPGNKALLKTMDERLRTSNKALMNRAVAGGATQENILAAKEKNNDALSGVYTQLLAGEEARRQAIRGQQMQLAQGHSARVQNNFLQDAQTWSNWGSGMADALMSFGQAALLPGKQQS